LSLKNGKKLASKQFAINPLGANKAGLPLFSKASILAGIKGQNFAGKRCVIASIKDGAISFKYHPFHR